MRSSSAASCASPAFSIGPLISPRPSGEYVGIDVEIMKLMAADLGVKLNIVNSEWATAVAGIEAKKWDIVPALCITDKRKEVDRLQASYITIGATLVTTGQQPEGADHRRGVQPAGGRLRGAVRLLVGIGRQGSGAQGARSRRSASRPRPT